MRKLFFYAALAALAAPLSARAAGICTFYGYEKCTQGTPHCNEFWGPGDWSKYVEISGLDPTTCQTYVKASWGITGSHNGYCLPPAGANPALCPDP